MGLLSLGLKLGIYAARSASANNNRTYVQTVPTTTIITSSQHPMTSPPYVATNQYQPQPAYSYTDNQRQVLVQNDWNQMQQAPVVVGQPESVNRQNVEADEYSQELETDPTTAWIFACVVFWLCCPLIGLVSIILLASATGTDEEKRKEYRKAKISSIVGLITGSLIMITLFLFFIFTHTHTNSY